MNRIARISMAMLVVAVACGGAKTPPQSPSPASASTTLGAPPTTTTNELLRRTDSFVPKRGDAAMRAFVPDVQIDEKGGECRTSRTEGSGAVIVSANYPTQKAADLQITVIFDSSGRLIRYVERRGMPQIIGANVSRGPAVLDSIFRAAEAKVRSTTIQLDYAIDQALVMNRGGGRPTEAVMSTVRAAEQLQSLGKPAARLERMRALCGV
jgi:hypothetical protein